MELIFLGTGSGIPSKNRNVSALALTLLQEENSIWLFDCGEATQHQIMHTSIKPRKINKIFITHLHGDHIFGLPGFLSSRSFQGGDDELTIYGPPGIKQYVETSLKVSGTHLTYPLSVVEFTEGKVVENNNFTVRTKKLEHGIASYGFRIVEKDKPGSLLVEKLQDQGIMPGPIYQLIKENDVVTTNDGKIIHRDRFLGPAKKGRIITIMGDTRNSDRFREFAVDSDILVHEATFDHSKADLARQYFHSTTVEAATLARDSQTKKLLLTHISSRYQKDESQKLLHEARTVFSNTELAHDFCRVKVDSK
ncbi:ribonuclease Z [Virgibacillus ihumii]|uniref:ribonuclease Z n=1 Tax=Virgibacillus ihumii TaxID=2686091 RepID=UPI00157DB5C0|nr:ribonuclease Z [Virgibacillus ihumii]